MRFIAVDQWRISTIRDCDCNFLRSARYKICEVLLTYVPFCENRWHIGFHKVLRMVAEGCHYERKGWFPLQVSDGACVWCVTLFYVFIRQFE